LLVIIYEPFYKSITVFDDNFFMRISSSEQFD